MAKIKFTENSKTFVMDTTQFISSALLTNAASNAFELLTASGLISLGGVANIKGSSGADTIKLLPGASVVDSVTLPSNPTITLDTQNAGTLVDTLTGSALAENVTFNNTLAANSNVVNVKYSSGSLTTVDTLTGGAGIDTITLGAASNILYIPTVLADSLNGSSGNDIIAINGAGTTLAFKTGGGIDRLTGTSGADTINLTAASNFSYATGGNSTDSINGSTGSDSIKLSSATTLTYATNSGSVDLITGSSFADTLTIKGNSAGTAAATFNYNAGSSNVADNLTLTSLADTITLTAASSVNITTGGGIDSIYGSSASDTITLVSATAPTIAFKTGGGIDSLTGTSGIDTINLTAASNFNYTTSGGVDVINGSTGSDIIKFTAPTTLTYSTNAGSIDLITGSSFADTLTIKGNSAGTAAATFNYNAGSSNIADGLTLTTLADTVTLTAASSVSIITGGGADSIYGSSASDTITATNTTTGVTITGNGGGDSLTGTAKTDSFTYFKTIDSGATTTTRDTITNFAITGAATVLDKLVFIGLLSGTAPSAYVTTFTGAGNSEQRFDTTSGLLELDTDGNGITDMSIVLTGVATAPLAANLVWS
ncbi:MAG: calcium-binding protein [Methylovulum sp.]|jgi:Ca2+-binding RTX toxin-like protein|nr:calcium-binding protein [Methylovulum sp.]